ncbi:methylene-tetrahydromethanopterin reductase [Prauserella marina]|uniref:5,10-methylenetetrahydromethanopterin reductase n=1 Tax=Prauserella marina TaxID=530584 RepID=A0A222VKP9_9PSEU|nr:LLM class flavin-dependent oxidoreductase [Prauserella marina]ASR34467.1 methylene-tetrahydromethanopterin reductase [Prauserella marina]PWV85941.1 alkanesulfonate monooxygenase SsuD/methylene tetrahydromethanopterin reductase-like flavin-dependent oxidoreductase (luciferase family) [Prauserella marina]SDC41801.1 5,10-methylenetetrahydromethanopterin reductase [Prauserella marina]
MEVSCAFPTALDTPANIAMAEQLGFHRAWVYDTPQQSPDVWMTLALAAERTDRIGLGPGVLVPSLRHPMVNASATATLCALAPGRVAVAFGTGFSGRRAMGYGAVRWSFMDAYLRAYRGLLRGEVVEWEGARMRMLHPEGHAPSRPFDVPVLVGALGPKGGEVARELGDGLFATLRIPDYAGEFSWSAYLLWGTVLDDDEPVDSAHARSAGGPGWALSFHGAYEFGGAEAVRALPGGDEWLGVVGKAGDGERHLSVHDGHCVELNEADDAAWQAGGHSTLRDVTLSGTTGEVRRGLDDLAARGVTEVVFQPCGPDVRTELERFLDVARAEPPISEPITSKESP